MWELYFLSSANSRLQMLHFLTGWISLSQPQQKCFTCRHPAWSCAPRWSACLGCSASRTCCHPWGCTCSSHQSRQPEKTTWNLNLEMETHTSKSVVIPASLQWPITWFFHWSMFLKLRNSHWLHFSLLIWQEVKQLSHFPEHKKSLEHTNLFSIWSFKVKFVLIHPRGWLLSHLDALDRICNSYCCHVLFRLGSAG